MKVVITGAKGQVGTALVNKFSGMHGVEVFYFDKENLDVTCKLSVSKTISSISPDIIVNAAAYTNVDAAENDEKSCTTINRDAVKFLAKSASMCGALLVHISTDYVFDGKLTRAYKEDDLVNPMSVYGVSKLQGEDVVKSSGASYIILRTSWVFSEYGKNFVKTMLRLGKAREEIGIVSDQIGGPTYAGDIADAIAKIATTKFNTDDWASGTYHFSGYPYVSWFDFADNIFVNAQRKKLFGKYPNLKRLRTDDYPTSAVRPANSSLCCESIKERFDISPSDWKLAIEDIERYTL